MPGIFKTAKRLNALLSRFPKLRRKIDSIGVEFHLLQENFSYDMEQNGEKWLLQTMAKNNLLTKPVFDVGANHGDWSAILLSRNPAASIHCFEICPPTYDKLVSNPACKQANVVFNQFGLADAPGEIEISYFPGEDGLTTIYGELHQQKRQSLKVKVGTGEQYCSDENIAEISLLKVDVEGAEHLVFKGFGPLLTPTKVPVIQFEYGQVNILSKFLLCDFYKFFESRGYRVGKLFPAGVRFKDYSFEDEDFRGPNYIAAGPDMVGLLGEEA
jgi:FkbM family methyltransferase